MENEQKKCPACGGAMDKGAFISGGSNYFLPAGEKRLPLYNPYKIKKLGGIPLPPDPWGSGLKVTFPAAWVCRNCRQITIPYDENYVGGE